MKKIFRIKKSEEFQSIIRKRKVIVNSAYILYYQVKVEEKGRIGIAVSKKLGIAVERNKMKRQLRMLLQETVAFEAIGWDGIIVAKARFKEQSYSQNKKDLESLVKTVKI